MAKDRATKSSAKAKGKGKPKVRFTAKAEPGKRKGSPSGSSSAGPSNKKQRTTGAAPAGAGTSTPENSSSTGAAPGGSNGASAAGGANANSSNTSTGTNTDGRTNADADAETPTKKRVRNPWGIRPKEVPKEARPTQRAFQRVIRAMCALLTQHDVLPSAVDKRNHYDKRYDNVDDFRLHMRNLVDQSRTAVKEASDRATKLIKEAKIIPGPIANDIARISEDHLGTVFTMVLKAGLKGFCPDVEGPVQSKYNQLHRHLAVSAFQFLSSSFGLMSLNVNNRIAQDHNLLCDMYDNFVYGTLAQKTKMERRRPGSLSKSLENTVAFKARTRVGEARFKTAARLQLRKPVQRIAWVKESHSDDEHSPEDGRHVRDKPGRNPVAGRFFIEELDVETEKYRARNARPGQRKPDLRVRDDPLLPPSDIGTVLPPEVPIDFFTPTFYNSLTVKERARYANTGVAFPLEQDAFDPAKASWKTMGRAEFMKAYGDKVLEQYKVPSAQEIAELSDSDDELDEEEEEINLADTDDEEEMEVDEELNP